MSVTSNSARVEYYVGDFDITTGITLPSADNNSLSLALEQGIGAQLASFANGLGDSFYILFRVLLNDTQIYKNVQYDSPDTGVIPSNPDITVTLAGTPITVEVPIYNNYVPMVVASDNSLSQGTYKVEAKFVYEDSGSPGSYIFEEGTFSGGYSFNEVIPDLFQKYNTGLNPFLEIGDQADYDTEASAPTFETEIIAYPPQNKPSITNTITSGNSVQFSSFWTGGNEMQVTSLFEYSLTDTVINYVVQAYESYKVYNLDNCTIFSCLDTLYDNYTASHCGTKKSKITEDDLLRANSLANQLIVGQTCGTKDLAAIFTEFIAICGCSDCSDCLDESVVQINSPNTVSEADRQTVAASTASTGIDLAQGSTITILATADTTLTVTNITQYSNYRLIFEDDGVGRTMTFDSGDFGNSTGALLDKTLNNGGKLIVDFYSEDATKLFLVSSSDGSGL